jgi:hypothetical protein
MTVIARGRFSATTYRRIASLLAAVVAAMTLTTAHAPAAHAAELPCVNGHLHLRLDGQFTSGCVAI